MIYFTSDLHLGHDKPFMYEPRGFKSIQEHDKAIIDNINSIVTNEDDLYILGDIIMGDQDRGIELLKSINGKKTIILGNHDTENKIAKYKSLGIPCHYMLPLRYGKYSFLLCHYPIKLFPNWDKPAKKSRWCLCGHVHSSNEYDDIEIGNYHVQLDAHENKPISINEVINAITSYKERRTKMLIEYKDIDANFYNDCEIVLNNAKNLLNELKGYGLDLIAASEHIENLLDEFEFLINQRQSVNTLDYAHYKEAVNVLVDIGLMSTKVVDAIGTDEDAYIPAINILSIGPLKKVYIYILMLLQKLTNDDETAGARSILFNCIYTLQNTLNENLIEESWKKLTNS